MGTAEADPAASGTSDRFHGALHELRTLELERLPKGARRVLSVGANGSWYFEWFRQAVGEVDEHIGIEAFEPRPDDLPDYVTWIVNTADQMVDVADGSIDLVFAGQTVEHLWAHELAGFLREARRVLRDGGLLVLDSPNRLVTEHLRWSHGGHTIEISADEITSLLVTAGFDVSGVHGIWECAGPAGVMGLEDGIDLGAVFARRCAAARDRVDDTFVWWVNATKSPSAPHLNRLDAEVADLFAAHWPTRISRGFFPGPRIDLPIPSGSSGRLATTLPFALPPGLWTLRIELADGEWDDFDDLVAQIDLPGGVVVHRLTGHSARRTPGVIEWTFDQPALVFAVSVSLHAANVRADAVVSHPLALISAG